MNRSPTTLNPLPPRLSMDEYADFVESSLRESNPTHTARQKELEKRIRASFRIVKLPALPTRSATALQARGAGQPAPPE